MYHCNKNDNDPAKCRLKTPKNIFPRITSHHTQEGHLTPNNNQYTKQNATKCIKNRLFLSSTNSHAFPYRNSCEFHVKNYRLFTE